MAKKDPIEKFISENIHYSKNKDNLLDVHIGNPLRRIAELLEEIKRQNAFSFTLKGSLGIAGVALALGVFGVLGGGRILCDKGMQTQIGTIKTLNVQEQEVGGLPIISNILDWFNPKQAHNRVVLIREDDSAISLPFSRAVNFTQYNNFQIAATGNYDSCAQTLTIKDPTALETYIK